MLQHWSTTFGKVRRDQTGNVLVLGAMSMTAMVGAAGLGMDTVQWSLAKRQLQQAADAAAVSGAYARANGTSVDVAAKKELSALDKVTLSAPAVIENAPTVGAYAGDPSAVRVALEARLPLAFSNLFLSKPTLIPATAVGKIVSLGTYCVVALDRAAITGIAVAGSASLNLGCGMRTNASGSAAISATGSSGVNVTSLSAVGKIPISSAYNADAKIYQYSFIQPDPYAALPVPAPTGCGKQVSVQPNRSENLQPGCYQGLDVKGALNLAPGIYYIDGSKGGGFSVGSQGTLNGTGVTIILTSVDASFNPASIAVADINGGATLSLTATTTGTYAGVLLYQDRRALDIATNQVNGNALSTLQGGLYFPGQLVSFTGNAGMQTQCMQLVAKRVSFSGNSHVSNSCPSNSGARSFDGLVVRLVA